MLELGTLVKFIPVAGAVVIAALSFGELSAKVSDLQNQCNHMQVQLDQIQNILETGHR